ncbi:uncharacterized protein L201_002717 [Kwoniella dendrophila CBS 6074]|uniref:Uncharacterized protein n=1 Tax=Kwoniella dendrophila CBS 6074 TaxID=1295534 RepID=A0AAX4JTE7_9TREE
MIKLPYNRPWLIEISDHPKCPKNIRLSCQKILTFLWLNRILPFQFQAPYKLASNVLERIINEIEYEQNEEEENTYDDDDQITINGDDNNNNSNSNTDIDRNNIQQDPIKIIDFCSGAGGPIDKIEKKINKNRKLNSLSPIQFLLSDLHPPLNIWKRLYGSPSSSSSSSTTSNKTISYIPHSVDATNTNLQDSFSNNILNQKHLRTFFLSFHHFNEELARSVLVDSMRNSDGICIFELQQCNLRSMFMIAMLGPLTWLITPFTRPSILTLFFTYIIPIIPLVLIIDGWISCYRTRSISHILRLTNLACLTLQLENQDKYFNSNSDNNLDHNSKEHNDDSGDQDQNQDEVENHQQQPQQIDYEWKWEFGKVKHTWPFGYMIYIIGRKKRIYYNDESEDDYSVTTDGVGL